MESIRAYFRQGAELTLIVTYISKSMVRFQRGCAYAISVTIHGASMWIIYFWQHALKIAVTGTGRGAPLQGRNVAALR
jgi:hypothetical protein